jgi:hypothetical protein
VNPNAGRIKSKCYWEVVIRPNDFVEQRVANRHLLTRIVRGATVTYQGYHFPHMSENERPESEADWVGQFLDLGSYLELWRAYLSGQFYHLSANHADWGYRHMLSPFERVADDEPFMGVGYSLFRFTLALEFAARLAFTDMGGDDMHVAVNVGNLGKRRLVSDDPNRLHLRSEPTAGLDDFHFIRELSRAELGANPRGLALEGAKEFFAIFDAAFTEELLKGWQEQWLRR